jgi:hypothetical protein
VSLRALHPLLRLRSSPKPGHCIQRDVLLLIKMIGTAEQAQELANGITAEQLADRQRRDSLLSNCGQGSRVTR